MKAYARIVFLMIATIKLTASDSYNSNNIVDEESIMKIMVVGGKFGKGYYLRNEEYLNPYHEINSCEKRKHYPTTVSGSCSSGNLVFGGSLDRSINITKETFEYQQDSWHRRNDMIIPRYDSSCIQLLNASYWVTGGLLDYHASEMLDDFDSGFKISSKLPSNMYAHCMGKINDTHVFIVGNFYYSSYLVDVSYDEFVFTPIPDMSLNHYYSGCGRFKDENGDQFLVVAGGFTNHDFGILSSSEILSVTEFQWRPGPNLPRGFAMGGYISDKNHPLIIVGGLDEKGVETDSIIEYQPDINIFQYLPGRLKIPRYAFSASTSYTNEDC